MNRMSIVVLAAAMAALLTPGCGGQYILTVPEQVGPAGGQAVIVSRLQMVEFTGYNPSVKDLALRCLIEKGQPRCAYTDRYGYAAVNLPLPAESGVYHVIVAATDKDGREVEKFSPVYVWQKDFPVVVVDLDALKLPAGDAQKDAMKTLSEQANIIYMTQRPVNEHLFLHDKLEASDLPDGAIMTWERKYYWRSSPAGTLSVITLQGKMISQLPELKETFPKLSAGITDSPAGVESFRSAGITPIFIGQEGLLAPKVGGDVRKSDWAEIAAKGLAVAQ